MKPFDQWVDDIADRQQAENGVDFFPDDLDDSEDDLDDGAEECNECQGTGKVQTTLKYPEFEDCVYCNGHGRVDEIKCRGCDQYGQPNYSSDGKRQEYYCGGNPYCCP